MNSDFIKTVETQNVVIKMQSGIIDELFRLLSQHITVEELEVLPVIGQINRAAEITNGLAEY